MHMRTCLCLLFVTRATTSDESLTFLMLGDWGKGGTSGSYVGNVQQNENVLSSGGDSNNILENSLIPDGNKATQSEKYYQAQVAAAMGKRASSMNPSPSFVIALGDNFYVKGVSSSTDSIWKYLWKNVYLGYTSLNIPWYPVFGNRETLTILSYLIQEY